MNEAILEIEQLLKSGDLLKKKIVEVAEKYRSYKIANIIYGQIYAHISER